MINIFEFGVNVIETWLNQLLCCALGKRLYNTHGHNENSQAEVPYTGSKFTKNSEIQVEDSRKRINF